MTHTYTTPAGEYPRIFEDMLQRHHVLIAGVTGSGKSTVISGIMRAAMYHSPAKVRFILIDPKRVELAAYSGLPHTITHAAGHDPKAWIQALRQACDIMDTRYSDMERRRKRMYDGSDVYVIIDELAMLHKSGGRACEALLLRLLSEGRAARVHVIGATQVPKASIIPTEIRENYTAKVCLHCSTRAQSRVLMDMDGCEALPQYGYGYYITPEGVTLYEIPYTEDGELERLVTYWTGPAGRGRRRIA